MKNMRSLVFALPFSSPLPSGRRRPRRQPRLPNRSRRRAASRRRFAKEAVDAAIAACTAQNLKVSAAVSDAAGLPVYVFVPDGVRNGTGDTAIRKNITMSITGKPASETVALAAADPAIEAKLAANPRIVAVCWRRAAESRRHHRRIHRRLRRVGSAG